ncbi:MAG: hypothetical protein HFI33_11670 [Lachnospiraceae bacterium]|nr:hypothetical protein [Lachnospiraceae bacterium]
MAYFFRNFISDYIYIPLGGNRVSKIRWIFNVCIVWLLTGLWHGTSWNFVVWGGYYAILLLLEKLVLRDIADRIPIILKWAFTFI